MNLNCLEKHAPFREHILIILIKRIYKNSTNVSMKTAKT